MSRTAFPIATLMALSCVRASVETLSPTAYRPISPDSVTVFIDASELQADSISYERIALVFLTGDRPFTSHGAMIRRAREEAGKLGANGVVIGGFEEGKGARKGWVTAVRWRIVSPRRRE